MSLGLADILRNLKISKHTGETNHLQYFDNVLKQWSSPCGPCELFPNVCISLRILLTIPATVASAERIFSKLEFVKNYLRSAMSQTRLVDPARLNIEPSIARKVDFDNIPENRLCNTLVKDFFLIFSLIGFYYEHLKVMFKKW